MDAVPVEPKDSRRVLCLAVDVAAYSPTVDRNLLRQQMRSLRDATLSALAFRERLNESEAEDGPLVLHLTGHGIRPAASRPDLAVGNLLVECKSWYDPNAAAYGLPKSDGLVPPWVEWHDEPAPLGRRCRTTRPGRLRSVRAAGRASSRQKLWPPLRRGRR
jgi:hypothetical protein